MGIRGTGVLGLPVIAVLCCLLPLSAWGQSMGPSPAWVASGDPCYTVKLAKKKLADPDQLECSPVKATVTWEVEETYTRPNAPPDRVYLKFQERFSGFLMLMRHRTAKDQAISLSVLGPAPCCPGNTIVELIKCRASLLICMSKDLNCRTLVVSTDNTNPAQFMKQFKVTPEDDDTSFSITWSQDQPNCNVEIKSSNIQLAEGVIRDPYRQHNPAILGVEEGGTYNLDLRGTSLLTGTELAQAINRGELVKTFPLHRTLETSVPGTTHTINGKVTVRLVFQEPEEECWLVKVQGWELDAIRRPLKAKSPGGYQKEFPIQVEFKWLLEAMISIERPKGTWRFKHGQVTKARLRPKINFKRPDLFKCGIVKCTDDDAVPLMRGSTVEGQRVGSGISLGWKKVFSVACVSCRAKKSYLGKYQYHERFGSEAFLHWLSKEILPLKHGYKYTRKINDWIRFTISLQRIKKGPCSWPK